MARKLSASSLKDLLNDYHRFESRFTSCIQLKKFNPAYVSGQCLHSIAEHYAKTWELNKQVWYDLLETKKWEFTIIIDDQIEHTREPYIDECIEAIENWFENMSGIIQQWEPEIKIEDENFTWFIDLIKDDEIRDRKFVNSYNKAWLFDSMPWYLIQWALYTRRYNNQYWKLPTAVKFIEILKKNTKITEPWYNTKEKIISLIEEDKWINLDEARTDRKMTREKLIEMYEPKDKQYSIINIIPDNSLLQFWEDVLELWIKIRNKIIDSWEIIERIKNFEWDELAVAIYDANAISDYISFYVAKFQKLVNSFCSKYYEQKTE